jgi:hypothetical protein
LSSDGGMSGAVIVSAFRRLRLKKNASDHPAAVEDTVIVFVSNPKILTSWRENEFGHALTRRALFRIPELR